MKNQTLPLATFTIIFLTLGLLSTTNALAHPSMQNETPTPTPGRPPVHAEIIDGVNNLRLSHGIAPLSAHPVLMQVGQMEADGIAAGREGHWRPDGLTLGQWLLSLGYPLSGDISLDGYRSENWGFANDAEGAVNMWLQDDLHENTMLSLDRSDIGVGIAKMPGEDVYVIVLETALQTKSGQMQYDAIVYLTGIPMTQAAYSSMATLAAENGLLPQNVAPVFLNTALPDGNIYHEVKYGQTLWSLAISYGATIKQIQQLNGLTDTNLRAGQKLLVMKGATQPAPASNSPTLAQSPQTFPTPTISPAKTATPESTPEMTPEERRQNTLGVVAIGVAAIFLGGLFTVMTRKKPA
jgi:uncharacterized protein YkwD